METKLRRVIDILRSELGLPGIIGKPTLDDVAERAGVSRPTLDGAGSVETESKIADAFGITRAELVARMEALK